jgi:hypothetical protein
MTFHKRSTASASRWPLHSGWTAWTAHGRPPDAERGRTELETRRQTIPLARERTLRVVEVRPSALPDETTRRHLNAISIEKHDCQVVPFVWISLDNVLYDGLREIADHPEIDTALLHLGGVELCALIRPSTAIGSLGALQARARGGRARDHACAR